MKNKNQIKWTILWIIVKKLIEQIYRKICFPIAVT